MANAAPSYVKKSFCFLFQLRFIRAYLAEQNMCDSGAEHSRIEEELIIEANRLEWPCDL